MTAASSALLATRKTLIPVARTLTDLDNSWYTLLTLNTAPHFDLEYGKDKEFGRTLMNSTLTLAVLLGIVSARYPGLVTHIASARLVSPLFGGDTLSVSSFASGPEQGLRVTSTGHNQAGTAVIEVEHEVAPASAGRVRDVLAAVPAVVAGSRAVTPVVAPHLEDFQVGHLYEHGAGRTVLADETVWMALLCMVREPVFFDRQHAMAQGLPDLLVERGFVLSIILGMSVKHTTQAAVANLGWRDVRFHEPVYPGDTLYAQTEVLAVRQSASRPGQGIVTVLTRGRNQRSDVVVSFERSFLTTSRMRAGVISDAQDRG